MNLSRVVPLLVALLIPIHAFSQPRYITRWELSEVQPNIKEGGRANTVAINPTNFSEMFVASDSGGLFKSEDGGVRWKHVDQLPVIFTQSVVYATPDILLVSAKADFKTKNGGGIWRSENGGDTWTQRELNIEGFEGRLSAYGISVMSTTVAVGTSEGVFLSDDRGKNWTYSNVFAGGNKTVHSVLVTPTSPTRVYAGGPSGVRLGTNPASTWESPVLDPGGIAGIRDIHAFSRSPLAAAQAFVVDGVGNLFRTENNGTIWTLMPSAPPGGNCAGIRFIKAVRRGSGPLELYLGNRCGLERLTAPVNGTSANYAAGTWQPATIDHTGTRDIAFFNGFPCLLGTNGGLHHTADVGWTWTLVGGGRDGYNALQVTEIKGQRVGLTTDLYFGTRDNNLWAMNVWGNTYDFHRHEGGFLEMDRFVETEKQSQITFMASGNNRQSGRHFADATDWNDPASLRLFGAPVLIRQPFHLQLTRGTPNIDAGLAVHDDTLGWRPFAAFPEEPRDMPRLGQSDGGNTARSSIVYQPYRSNALPPGYHRASRLMRIHKRLVPQESGTVFYPQFTDFGALGINPTMDNAWYSVFGVDTGDAGHIIAPDVIQEYVLESRIGGEGWTLVHHIKNLVTANGERLFVTDLNGAGPVVPIVSAVSFSPQDPDLVLLGTHEGGIFFSDDNGASWQKIAGTERATYITSFYWQNANTVWVSTFGRGIWRLSNTRVAVSTVFDDLCDPCEVLSNDGSPQPPPLGGSVMAFEGRILGVRTENDLLREVFVTPGSSVLFTGDQEDPQQDIAITEHDGRDTSQFAPLPKGPDGWMIRAVVFTSDDELTGTAFAESELSLLPPPSEKELGGSTESPTRGTPYIRVISSAYYGVAAAAPQEVFELSATDFIAGASYEVLVDGESLKENVTADGNGCFIARITAPSEHGYHTVAVRMAGEEAVIDASTVLVRN